MKQRRKMDMRILVLMLILFLIVSCEEKTTEPENLNPWLIYKTTNAGKQWEPVYYHESDNFWSISCANDSTLMAVGQNGVMVVTSDAGASWFHLSKRTTNNLWKVVFTGKACIAIGDDGDILFSQNIFLDWEFVQSPGVGETLWDISFFTDDSGVIVGDEGTLLRTIDGGRSWAKVPLDSSLDIYTVHAINDSIAYLAGQDGIIMRTIDRGLTWEQVVTGSNHRWYDVFFADISSGFVAGPDYFMHTSDGGTSWDSFKTNRYLYCLHFLDPLNGVAGGLDADWKGIIVYTENGGESWVKAGISVEDEILAESEFAGICFINNQIGYAVTYYWF